MKDPNKTSCEFGCVMELRFIEGKYQLVHACREPSSDKCEINIHDKEETSDDT